MTDRRSFIQGAIAFTAGGATALLGPREARAQGAPFRMLTREEGDALEALGETLVPGARAAGIAHFIDHQVSVPPEEALLEARIVNVKPPFINFYRAALGALERAMQSVGGRRFASLSASEQRDFVNLMRQNKVEGWQ